MLGRRRNLQPSTQAPQLAAYWQQPLPDPGALAFVYRKPVSWPLFTMWGDGILNRLQFNCLQSPQLRNVLALTVAPIVGPGYPAGQWDQQGLEDNPFGNTETLSV